MVVCDVFVGIDDLLYSKQGVDLNGVLTLNEFLALIFLSLFNFSVAMLVFLIFFWTLKAVEEEESG